MINKLKNGFRKKQTTQLPRELSVLQVEFKELSSKAGQLRYQIYVHEKDLETLNQAMLNISKEAGARQQLDAQTVKPQPAPQEQPKETA
jgi:hypothetical protein